MRVSLLTCTILLALAHATAVRCDDTVVQRSSTDKVDFVRDIQPILSRSCLSCHGPLRAESGYRVDVREIALNGGDNYAPNIIPGKSTESPVLDFVSGKVDGMLMPAKGDRLSEHEISLLRAWIDQGAVWPDSASATVTDKRDWWSLRPLVQPLVPDIAHAESIVDAFIQQRLAIDSIEPAPPAEPRTLIRRLYFDLTGLPPSPEVIAAFESDTRPDAYERVVDRLLASPRYGERWARHWMDTAHFAETHGHDQDRIREHAWPYRDYLIDAFNDDIPYTQFVTDQIAADALAIEQPARTAALGFLAAGPWDESTLRDIREDTIDREIGRYLDRDDMLTNVMNNFVSMTVNCARCHDHKFDPIPQTDYYALQAVFAGVERASRSYDVDQPTQLRRAALRQRLKQLDAPESQLRAELLSESVQGDVHRWESQLANRPVAWVGLSNQQASSTDGSTLTLQPDGSFLASGTRPERDTYVISGGSSLRSITAVRLEVLSDPSLPMRGPGRQENGNLHLSEIEILLDDRPVSIRSATSDFDQVEWGVARAIDGKPETAWGIYPQVGQSHEAIFELSEPLNITESTTITVRLKQLHGAGHLIGRPRITLTSAATPIAPSKLPSDIQTALAKPTAERSDEERLRLALHYERERVSNELNRLPKSRLVYAAAADFEPDGALKPPPGPRPIHRLKRGDIRQKLEPSEPGALSCIEDLRAQFSLPAGAPESARRAELARWLVDPNNPLTWRSIVNRTWQQHFGRGIVETVNDFGRMGAQPSHPQLLDWLAVEFRDSPQSLKALHRRLVTSAAYRQSSGATLCSSDGTAKQRTDRAMEVDPDNRLFWRMHRARLDAESVRDAMLVVNGQIDWRMGGPSDRHFDLQPGRHVTPVIDYGKFDLSSGLAQRRGVYRFLFRTLPDPFMESLDCPAGDQIMPTRTNSVTVQQALALWNDAFVLKQSEVFAQRLERAYPTPAEQVARAVQLTLGRAPNASELEKQVNYAARHGLANLCRVLFSSNEFMFVD